MTTLQLQQSVLQGIASLLDDQVSMEKILQCIRQLQSEKEAGEEMTPEEKEEILNDIREGLRELKAAREGKIKLQSVEEFLDELRG